MLNLIGDTMREYEDTLLYAVYIYGPPLWDASDITFLHGWQRLIINSISIGRHVFISGSTAKKFIANGYTVTPVDMATMLKDIQ